MAALKYYRYNFHIFAAPKWCTTLTYLYTLCQEENPTWDQQT